MRQITFSDLLIIHGKDLGMRFSVEEGTYRVLGKRNIEDLENNYFEFEQKLFLNPDQQEAIDHHINSYFQGQNMNYQKRGPDILLSDISISRVHCAFFNVSNQTTAVDLMSENGTFLDEKEIKLNNLAKNDIVTLGNTKIKILPNS